MPIFLRLICALVVAMAGSSDVLSAATSEWTTTGSLATARILHTSTLLPSGKVLVVGGSVSGSSNTRLTSCELYDPVAGTWLPAGSLGTARYFHTAIMLPSGKVLVVGGVSNSALLSSCEIYDPITDSWSPTGSMSTVRRYHTSVLLSSGKVLAIGGDGNGGRLSSCEQYDPVLGTWSSTGALSTARYWNSSTLLPSGMVLVTGGSGDGGDLASSELYDPVTGTWSVTGALATARREAMSTLLPTGKVLVTGGVTNLGGVYLASSELYDPALGSWSTTGSMATPRLRFTLASLSSGKVLVTGGTGSFGSISSSEIYNPSTGSWAVTGSLAMARYWPTSTLLPSGKVLVTGGSGNAAPLSSSELYESGEVVSATPVITWANPLPITYGTTLSAAQLNASTGVAGTFAYTPSAGALLSAGSHSLSVTFTPTDTATYTAVSKTVTLPVNHAALTIVANDASRAYGLANPTFTGTLSGVVAGDAITGTYVSSATASTAVGTYGPLMAEAITPTLVDPGGRLVNYIVTSTKGTLSISPVGNDNFVWAATSSMSTARQDHTSTLLPSGKVLITGGQGHGVYMSSCELYDPSSATWSFTGSLGTARFLHTSTLLPSGQVLVSGGYDARGYPLSSCELYDPSVGTWSLTGSLGAARVDHASTLLPSGTVLVTGGYNSAGVRMLSCELYDPNAGTWTSTGSLGAARRRHTSTLLTTGQVLVTGGDGIGDINLSSCELYDPSVGTWRPTESLSMARFDHKTTLLPSGKVLVIGGGGYGPLALISELYDPSVGTWSSTGSLAVGRRNHTATLLSSGKVLAVGGGGVANQISSCELYDPSMGTWSSAGLLNTARRNHTSTLLSSGMVLVTGGQTSANFPPHLSSSELYGPGAATPITPVITWTNPPAITYGTTLSAAQSNASTGVAGTFAYTPSAGALLNAGDHPLSVTFTPTDTAAYTAASKTVTLTVNKAALTVTAQNQGRTYGAANQPLTATITGYLNGDSSAVISGSASLSTSATTASPVATYPIMVDVSGMSATNYAFVGINGALTVSKATLTIVAADASRVYGESNPTFTGTHSGVVPGDEVIVSYSSVATATTPVGVYGPQTAETIVPQWSMLNTLLGNYEVTATSGVLTITAAPQVVDFADLAPRTYGDAPFVIAGVTGGMSGQPVVFTSDNPAVATVSGVTVTITGAGTATITATQAGDANFEAAPAVTKSLVVAKAALSATAANATRAYGEANPLFVGTLTGVVAGDMISATYASTATAATAAGVYGPTAAEAITPTLVDSGSRLGNYTVTSVNGTLTITPAINDDFANAQPLLPMYGGALASSNVGATKQVGEPRHAGQVGGASLWWTWTAPAEGTLVVQTTGSAFDTVLAAYTGTAVNALTAAKSNDNISSTVLQSKITVTVVAGTTYRIAVDRKTAAGGDIALAWSFVETNNAFAGARLVTGESGSSSASNRNGTRDTAYNATTDSGGDPGINGRGIGRSFWWKWVAPRNGTLYVSTEGSLTDISDVLDTVLAVSKGATLSALKVQACNDDTPGGDVHAEVGIKVVSGTTYYFCVDTSPAALSPDGVYTVTWSMQPLIPQ